MASEKEMSLVCRMIIEMAEKDSELLEMKEDILRLEVSVFTHIKLLSTYVLFWSTTSINFTGLNTCHVNQIFKVLKEIELK